MKEICFSDAASSVASDVISSRSLTKAPRKRSYEIHSRWVFLTYAQCGLKLKGDFELAFMKRLGRIGYGHGKYYGCLEHHSEEKSVIHYHVLVNFGKQPSWTLPAARKFLRVEGDRETYSLNIVTPSRGQKINNFIQNHVLYVEKYGDVFGVRPLVGESLREEKKRKWAAVSDEKSVVAKLQKVKDEFPDTFYKCFNSIQSAVKYEHRDDDVSEAFQMPSFVDTSRFVVPDEVLEWEFQNLVCPQGGRRKSLLIVGESRTGKSTLAQYLASRYGVFSEFDTEWNMDAYRKGHVCAVFHDIRKPFPYWKAVFECQPFFTAHGRYASTRELVWNVPSIWVCDREDDPRDWGEAERRCISQNSVVYEIPSGHSFVHQR
ncbi:hypothetical protein BCON_0274g00050 [Botryotinia convoluta]|uniref:Geminivirus AL1 replication-associated protein catalytic domain-containing protein n=1 Tax=Botryotinia convoluta TaxID=54673 RepID=A0A4Z1HED1_9HELO|nr:hypothetical protein BCON_0274g00050 [Botryotinia convoluta]